MTFEELFNLAFLAPDPGPEWLRLVEEAREEHVRRVREARYDAADRPAEVAT